ncbi:hypothetical protein BOX15_Mlig031165g1 [Macrostomum lignano]|uniref:Uncharacterized protein n=1 Tax=Macrostomum lignano TaxID=282301 RepID=A0A267DNS2_9PLAT|nr:hypothetical protein BOX15_Mlig031165g2 [Macrostomum lignano]PAA88221.1 hypothetical protein BOX15_Mlig031165g1 [Macrostomum lignano]
MKLIVCAALFAIVATVSAQPGGRNRLTEGQLEAFLRPCIVNGVRCPPDGSLSYDKIVENMENTKMATRMLAGELPSECDCDDSSERCNRRCMYAMMKVLILEYNIPVGAPQSKRFFGFQG